MKSRLVNYICICSMSAAGVWAAGGDVNHVWVLCYHEVTPYSTGHAEIAITPSALRQQWHALKKHGYVFVTMDEWHEAVCGARMLPEKAVIITFDDGWRGQYEHAASVLDELKITGTFYICVETLGTPGRMRQCNVKELARRGHVIGCHSATHEDLTVPHTGEHALDYEKRLTAEVTGAKRALEKLLAKPVRHFAYPYGSYTTNIIRHVRAAGYETAATINPVANDCRTPLITLGRLIITPANSETNILLARLAARPLHLAGQMPEDGAVIAGGTSLFIASLPRAQCAWAHVRAKLNWRWVDACWHSGGTDVCIPLDTPLRNGSYAVQVHAWDERSNWFISASLFQCVPNSRSENAAKMLY